MKNIILFFILAFRFISCGQGINEPFKEDPELYFEKTNHIYPDSILINIAYNGPKYIGGFYYEDLSNILFNQIGEFREFNSVYSWYEPSVIKEDSARRLVNQRVLFLRGDTANVIQGNHTDKYFEFIYPNYLTSSNWDFYLRVHKSSYFEGIYYSNEDETKKQIIQIGTINVKDLSSSIIKELFERLWYYQCYNWGGAKVLESYTSKKGQYFLYVIYYITIVYGDYSIMDEISLIKSEYLVNEKSRNTLIKNQNIKIVHGRGN